MTFSVLITPSNTSEVHNQLMEGLDKEEETASISHIIYVAWQECQCGWPPEPGRQEQVKTILLQYKTFTHEIHMHCNALEMGRARRSPFPNALLTQFYKGVSNRIIYFSHSKATKLQWIRTSESDILWEQWNPFLFSRCFPQRVPGGWDLPHQSPPAILFFVCVSAGINILLGTTVSTVEKGAGTGREQNLRDVHGGVGLCGADTKLANQKTDWQRISSGSGWSRLWPRPRSRTTWRRRTLWSWRRWSGTATCCKTQTQRVLHGHAVPQPPPAPSTQITGEKRGNHPWDWAKMGFHHQQQLCPTQLCTPDSRGRLEQNIPFKEHTNVLFPFYGSESDDVNQSLEENVGLATESKS